MDIKAKDEKAVQILAHVVLIFLSAMAILPFILLVSASFSDEATVITMGYRFIPTEFSLNAYAYIFEEWMQIGRAYGITIFVTVVGTVASILMTSMFAYGLTQTDVKGVKILFIFVLFTMLFNGGIVPTFYVYTNIVKIRNTIWALILPNLLMNAFNIILVKNYFKQNIPAELLESAEMDGAGYFTIYYKIIMPLSMPILATIGLLTGVSYWNDWTNGLYFINDESLYSIQHLLNKINENILALANNSANLGGIDLSQLPSATMRMAVAVVAIVPIIIAYPFFQKYFAKGITLGAVKG